MNTYKQAEKTLKQKYNISVIQEIVLARTDRAIYYVEYLEQEMLFSKIHGKSPMDLFENGDSFPFTLVEDIFDMDSKYGEVAGRQYYKINNLNQLKNLDEESNITIPLQIHNQRYWLRFHLYSIKKDEQGKTILASCYITDVTKYLVNEELLYEKTHKDELTQLFNRYALYYHFELHGSRVPLVSFYFDIDNFKHFNDEYGHDIGDEVLTLFSDRLKRLFNDNFICYRLGGDEFYCLLFQSNLTEAKEYVNKIQDSIRQCKLQDIEDKLSVSIGVAYSEDPINTKYVAFMEKADKLMYESKKAGKNQATYGEFVVFKN